MSRDLEFVVESVFRGRPYLLTLRLTCGQDDDELAFEDPASGHRYDVLGRTPIGFEAHRAGFRLVEFGPIGHTAEPQVGMRLRVADRS